MRGKRRWQLPSIQGFLVQMFQMTLGIDRGFEDEESADEYSETWKAGLVSFFW